MQMVRTMLVGTILETIGTPNAPPSPAQRRLLQITKHMMQVQDGGDGEDTQAVNEICSLVAQLAEGPHQRIVVKMLLVCLC